MFKFWFGSLVGLLPISIACLNGIFFARFFVDDGRVGAVKSFVNEAHVM